MDVFGMALYAGIWCVDMRNALSGVIDMFVEIAAKKTRDGFSSETIISLSCVPSRLTLLSPITSSICETFNYQVPR